MLGNGRKKIGLGSGERRGVARALIMLVIEVSKKQKFVLWGREGRRT